MNGVCYGRSGRRRSKDMEISKSIDIFPLPPYSPRLNPVVIGFCIIFCYPPKSNPDCFLSVQVALHILSDIYPVPGMSEHNLNILEG